jgi:hypothetical protein
MDGDWKETKVGTIFEGRLFTIEKKGTLFATEVESGKYVAVGKPIFANTAFLFAGEDSLYTITRDGNLYRVHPKDGKAQQLGQPGAWKNTLAGAFLGGALYTVESSGNLYRTNLSDGNWAPVSKPEFGGTAFLFAGGDKLYVIEKEGNLYRVTIK